MMQRCQNLEELVEDEDDKCARWDNKSEATAALKRIRRIRLALIDLDKH
jgi:hypothetical protein